MITISTSHPTPRLRLHPRVLCGMHGSLGAAAAAAGLVLVFWVTSPGTYRETMKVGVMAVWLYLDGMGDVFGLQRTSCCPALLCPCAGRCTKACWCSSSQSYVVQGWTSVQAHPASHSLTPELLGVGHVIHQKHLPPGSCLFSPAHPLELHTSLLFPRLPLRGEITKQPCTSLAALCHNAEFEGIFAPSSIPA